MTEPNSKPAKPAYGPGSNFKGKAGRSGPKAGNLNSLKTGSKLSRRRLVVGELPKQLLSVRREARGYRASLEEEVLVAKGEISVLDCHLIDTATAATIQAGILRWTRRHRFAEMNVEAIERNGERQLKAKQARDAAVKALALDVKPEPIDLRTYIADGAGGTDK